MKQLEFFSFCPICNMLLSEQQMCGQDTSNCIYYEHFNPEEYFEELPEDEADDEDNQPQPW